MKTLPVLGYWNIRGLAQPIRVLLGYAGVEFEEKHYVIGDGPEFSYEYWYKEKFELGEQMWSNCLYGKETPISPSFK